jgi:transposase
MALGAALLTGGTDEEWRRIEPFLPGAAKSARRVETDLREVLNAIRYMARSGGGWRMLPKDFPPWQTVYWWFRRFVRRFMFQTIHDVALMLNRERVGREASPTGGVVDSQSVKAPGARTRGYDAGKKIVGRKRHIAVDYRRSPPDGQSPAVLPLAGAVGHRGDSGPLSVRPQDALRLLQSEIQRDFRRRGNGRTIKVPLRGRISRPTLRGRLRPPFSKAAGGPAQGPLCRQSRTLRAMDRDL